MAWCRQSATPLTELIISQFNAAHIDDQTKIDYKREKDNICVLIRMILKVPIKTMDIELPDLIDNKCSGNGWI